MKMLKSVCILVLIVGIAFFAFSETAKRTAKITALTGRADVKQMGEWGPAEIGMVLNEGDTLRTKPDSWVLLNLNGGGETASVEVEESSELMFSELIKDEEKGTQQTLLDLAMGEVLIQAQKLHSTESNFEVKTPTSIVGVRGTKFSVKVEALEE